jgi:hypothetical protein
MSDNPFLGPWARKPDGTPITQSAQIHDRQATVKHDLKIGDIIKVEWKDKSDWNWFRYLGPRNTSSGWGIELQGVTDYESQALHEGDIFLVPEESFTVVWVIPRDKAVSSGFPFDLLLNQSPATTEKVADVGFPVKGSDDVTFAVMTDLSARSIAGTKKYGECLCAGRKCANDKSNLQNLYEELLDAACYLKKQMMEEK